MPSMQKRSPLDDVVEAVNSIADVFSGKRTSNKKPKLPRAPKAPNFGLWWFGIWALMIPGLCFASFALAEILNGIVGGGIHSWQLSLMVGMLVGLGALPIMGAGALYLEKGKRLQQHRRDVTRWLEACVLHCAAFHQGKVTAMDVAMETNAGLDEVTEILDRLVSKRAAELMVTDSGSLIYQFHLLEAGQSRGSLPDENVL